MSPPMSAISTVFRIEWASAPDEIARQLSSVSICQGGISGVKVATTEETASAASGANVVAARYSPRSAPSVTLAGFPSRTPPAAVPRPPIDAKRAWFPSSLLRSSSRAQAQASRTVAPALTIGGLGERPLDQV